MRPFRVGLPCTDLWVMHPNGRVDEFVTLTIAEMRDLLLAGAVAIWPKARSGVRRHWFYELAPCELEQDPTLVALRDTLPPSHVLNVWAGAWEVVALAFPKRQEPWLGPGVTEIVRRALYVAERAREAQR